MTATETLPRVRRWLAAVALALAQVTADSAEWPRECNGVSTGPWTSQSHGVLGYHVLCFGDAGTEVCANAGGEDASCKGAATNLAVTTCWEGRRDTCEEIKLPSPTKFLELEESLIGLRPLGNPRRYERLKKGYSKKGKWKGLFAFYKAPEADEVPLRIRNVNALSGLVLAFEGGSFVWPGIQTGFSRNVTIRPNGQTAKMLSLNLLTQSLSPLVIEVSSFLDKSECSHIIEKAKPHVAKSVVSHMDHDVGKPDTNWRSSSTYFMPSDDDMLRKLDERVSALTLTKKTHQEYAQVLRYEHGERYAAHHDFFDPDMYQQNADIQGMTKKGLFNRMATVFFYLTTVEAGGHTNFPRAGGLPQPRDFESCERGVSIAPKEGRIIIFYSQDAAANLDEYSLHGGCAVKEGIKWSANKWIWNKPMDFIS